VGKCNLYEAMREQACSLWAQRSGRNPYYAAPETSMTLSLIFLVDALRAEVLELKKQLESK
jgi:hypothetical protein